jgi:hypothetical protein
MTARILDPRRREGAGGMACPILRLHRALATQPSLTARAGRLTDRTSPPTARTLRTLAPVKYSPVVLLNE